MAYDALTKAELEDLLYDHDDEYASVFFKTAPDSEEFLDYRLYITGVEEPQGNGQLVIIAEDPEEMDMPRTRSVDALISDMRNHAGGDEAVVVYDVAGSGDMYYVIGVEQDDYLPDLYLIGI